LDLPPRGMTASGSEPFSPALCLLRGLGQLPAQAAEAGGDRGPGTGGPLRPPPRDAPPRPPALAPGHRARPRCPRARPGGDAGAAELAQFLAGSPQLLLATLEIPEIEQVAARQQALLAEKRQQVLPEQQRAEACPHLVELALRAHRLEQRVVAERGE